MRNLFLGIDTSNYTTSVALTDENGSVIADKRQVLSVKKGERGLRQQEALFQHVKNLPSLIDSVFKDIEYASLLKAISVSTKPRNIESSYMPVFEAGKSFANTIGSVLKIPVYEFSHQEGHIKAISAFNDIRDNFICFHISGGTTEILKVDMEKDGYSYNTEIIGKTLDISIGQLIDRIGVALGMEFPAGESMDTLALTGDSLKCSDIKHIHMKEMDINLSGIETQLLKKIDLCEKEDIASRLFTEIFLCLQKSIKACKNNYPDRKIIFAGGVSQSDFLRKHLKENVIFGKFGSDNAVGISLLGGLKYACETC